MKLNVPMSKLYKTRKRKEQQQQLFVESKTNNMNPEENLLFDDLERFIETYRVPDEVPPPPNAQPEDVPPVHDQPHAMPQPEAVPQATEQPQPPATRPPAAASPEVVILTPPGPPRPVRTNYNYCHRRILHLTVENPRTKRNYLTSDM